MDLPHRASKSLLTLDYTVSNSPTPAKAKAHPMCFFVAVPPTKRTLAAAHTHTCTHSPLSHTAAALHHRPPHRHRPRSLFPRDATAHTRLGPPRDCSHHPPTRQGARPRSDHALLLLLLPCADRPSRSRTASANTTTTTTTIVAVGCAIPTVPRYIHAP
jgi:hypothetical protein